MARPAPPAFLSAIHTLPCPLSSPPPVCRRATPSALARRPRPVALRRPSPLSPLSPRIPPSPTPSFPRMRLRGGGSGSGPPPAPPFERVLATLPYLIPLLDSLSFGKYVFAKLPLLGSVLLGPLFPLYTIYRGVPFLAFGVFLALFILVVRNSSVSRYIRFNTYQALVLDIALILPQLFQGVNAGGFIPAAVVEVCSTAVFYAVSLAIVYAVVTNAKGQVPDEIPGISNSVYQQLGPF